MTSSSGTNAIGILPGTYWGTPQDRPIIVGSHWDSVSNSPGYNDNGSGMAALLVLMLILK
jgi:Zn-dependent M28 family amino/carboxypeptidase